MMGQEADAGTRGDGGGGGAQFRPREVIPLFNIALGGTCTQRPALSGAIACAR
jgi:hypothetical protein